MDTTRDSDHTISIDCKAFRKILAMKMSALAAERCRHMLINRKKKEDDPQDEGYMVSRFAFPKLP
jgi:hypothetical protein